MRTYEVKIEQGTNWTHGTYFVRAGSAESACRKARAEFWRHDAHYQREGPIRVLFVSERAERIVP